MDSHGDGPTTSSASFPGAPIHAHRRADAALMTTDAHRALAAWALASEMGSGREAADVHVGAERTCQKLCQRLSLLITVDGYRALLARALRVAAVEFPFLNGSQGPFSASACLGELPASDGVSEATTQAGLTAVLAGVIALSNTFIGEGLTMRAVQDAWPGAPVIGSGEPIEETQR